MFIVHGLYSSSAPPKKRREVQKFPTTKPYKTRMKCEQKGEGRISTRLALLRDKYTYVCTMLFIVAKSIVKVKFIFIYILFSYTSVHKHKVRECFAVSQPHFLVLFCVRAGCRFFISRAVLNFIFVECIQKFR